MLLLNYLFQTGFQLYQVLLGVSCKPPPACLRHLVAWLIQSVSDMSQCFPLAKKMAKKMANLKETKGLLQSSLTLFAQSPYFTLTEEVFHSVAILSGLNKIMDLLKSSGTTNQLVSFLGAKKKYWVNLPIWCNTWRHFCGCTGLDMENNIYVEQVLGALQ